MVDVEQVLQPVNKAKQQRFAKRLKQFRGDEDVQDSRNWTIGTYHRHHRDLVTTIQDVEDHLTDIDDQISRLEGSGTAKHFEERIKEDVDTQFLRKLEEKRFGQGNYRLELRSVKEGWSDLARLTSRKVAWKTYQFELMRIGERKLYEVANNLADLQDVMEKLEELHGSVQDIHVEPVVELPRQVEDVDVPVNSDDAGRDDDREEVDVGENNDDDEEEEDEPEREPDYLLKDRPADEQREVLEEMLDDERVSSWNSGAKHSDVSRNGLKSVVERVNREEDVDIDITA